MVHWPKSIGGNVFALMLALIVVVGSAQLAIALSTHPALLAFLVVGALTTAALIVRHRRAAAAQDLALADAPSFGDVLPHWDRHDDLVPVRRSTRV
jgi:fructose-specific phosphotransferase system IIC component